MATWIMRTAEGGPGYRVAVKDLIDLAGTPTTSGSKVIAATAEEAEADALCLAGTRRAVEEGRCTIVGKTNLHELAFGVTGINPWFGTPVNPYGADLVPGGSSSGSATAVASGEADIAYGSDTGGSIRIPAACCGVVGLKTTRARVAVTGVRTLARSLDTIGPMGATVAAVSEGMKLLEPGFAPSPAPASRIGRVRFPAMPYIDQALDRALAESEISVTEITLDDWDDVTLAAMTILGAEAWEEHAGLWRAHAGELSPDVAARLEASSYISAEEVAACWERARSWVSQLGRIFEQVDLLALPTIAEAPPTLQDAARLTEIRYVSPFNLSGSPALAMPVRGGDHVPPSLQLVGPAGGEELLVATAAAIEAAAGSPPG